MFKKAVIALSGGVDSSVSALLLKKKYKVLAVFIKSWEECSSNDYEDALLIAEKLKIPLHVINFEKEYKEKVFKNFLQEYKKGNTPNPDILCNKEIKFKLLLEKIQYLDADFLATGHYAQILKKENHLYLLKGKDPLKDQSYFLYTLKEDILKKILFPIGKLSKKKVRKIAKENNLVTAEKKDSTGICFIGKKDFRPFLSKYIPCKKGNILSTDGKILGTHDGAHLYTIGQRKGLKIGGKGKAWFVADKDIKNNILIAAQGEDHPSLFKDTLNVHSFTWVNNNPDLPICCKCKIRYRQKDQECIVKKDKVFFSSPQRAITKGQAVVFYNDNICLGGGVIEK